jgi:plasmid stabilization system protein ParE
MASLKLLPEAIEDLFRLDASLRTKNPKAADAVSQRLDDALSQLERFPRLGRPLDDHPPFREFVAPFSAGGYVIRYRITGDEVVVVRVWHSRELRD